VSSAIRRCPPSLFKGALEDQPKAEVKRLNPSGVQGRPKRLRKIASISGQAA